MGGNIMETTTIISLGALLVAVLSLVLNSKKETKSDAAALAEIKAGLNSANAGINDVRVDIRSMRDAIGDHSERIAQVEARLNQLERK